MTLKAFKDALYAKSKTNLAVLYHDQGPSTISHQIKSTITFSADCQVELEGHYRCQYHLLQQPLAVPP
jgi:hypothetical protein